MVSDSASWSGPTSPPAADRPAKPGQAAPVRAKRKGKNPGLASICRALAQHQKRQRSPKPSNKPTPTSPHIRPIFPEYYGDPIIHERTMAGLLAARAQGRGGGRPTVMDADKLAAARARRARGESPAEIARALGVSRASVYRHLAATES